MTTELNKKEKETQISPSYLMVDSCFQNIFPIILRSLTSTLNSCNFLIGLEKTFFFKSAFICQDFFLPPSLKWVPLGVMVNYFNLPQWGNEPLSIQLSCKHASYWDTMIPTEIPWFPLRYCGSHWGTVVLIEMSKSSNQSSILWDKEYFLWHTFINENEKKF